MWSEPESFLPLPTGILTNGMYYFTLQPYATVIAPVLYQPCMIRIDFLSRAVSV